MLGPRRAVIITRGYSAEAAQFFARIANTGTARKALYAALIDALAAAGVWSKLDALYVFAAADEATALVNLKSASFAATLVNAPVFTADRGFLTDGAASFVNTNYNTSTAGGNLVQDSATFGFWSRTAGQTSAGGGSETTNTGSVSINPRSAADTFQCRVCTNATTTAANIDGTGFYAGSRVASTTNLLYKNGAPAGSGAATSQVPANVNVTLGKSNNTFGAREFAAAVVGAGLNDAEHLALYNALNSYMTAVGAA